MSPGIHVPRRCLFDGRGCPKIGASTRPGHRLSILALGMCVILLGMVCAVVYSTKGKRTENTVASKGDSVCGGPATFMEPAKAANPSAVETASGNRAAKDVQALRNIAKPRSRSAVPPRPSPSCPLGSIQRP